MDNRLVNELYVLGPNDVELRRRNLQNLLFSLTTYEIRELGELIAGVDLRTDIITRLPVELRLQIARHVDGVDVINFLNVSRTWRQVWLQEDMLRFITNRWMSGFIQYYSQKEKITSTRQDIAGLFYEAARRFRSRSLGEFRSIMIETTAELIEQPEKEWWDTHDEYDEDDDYWDIDKNLRLDPELHSPSEEGEDPWDELFPIGICGMGLKNKSDVFLYSEGRVAWQLSHQDCQLIVVDNLYHQLRKAFKPPGAVMHGGMVKLVALGNKLVVTVLDRTLHAWDLETNNHGSVTLPSSDFKCETRCHYVYIYPRLPTEQFWIYAWKFKESLRDLDTKPLLEAIRVPHGKSDDTLSWRCIGILPHLLLDATMFVVCELGSNISLHKYTQGVYSTSYSFDISKEEGFSIQRPLSERLSRISSFGKYAVAVLGRDIIPEADHGRLNKQAFRLVCFDTLGESFSTETYHIPGWSMEILMEHDLTPEATWWNGELTSFTRFGSFAELESFRLPKPGRRSEDFWRPKKFSDYLATTREISRIVDGDSFSEIPVHAPNSTSGKIFERRTKKVKLDQEIPANIGRRIGGCVHTQSLLQYSYPLSQQRAGGDNPQLLWADDDFIILRYVDNDGGYVAWSFGKNFIRDPAIDRLHKKLRA